MKRLFRHRSIFGMANINPKRSGLKVIIWADHSGVKRNKKDHKARLKLGTDDYAVSVSIEPNPEVLAPKNWNRKYKKSIIQDIEEGIGYVASNYDLFLKHYNDTDFSFDDEDLFDALRQRGFYK